MAGVGAAAAGGVVVNPGQVHQLVPGGGKKQRKFLATPAAWRNIYFGAAVAYIAIVTYAASKEKS